MSDFQVGDRVRITGGPLTGRRASITGTIINAMGFFYTVGLEDHQDQVCPPVLHDQLEHIDAARDAYETQRFPVTD